MNKELSTVLQDIVNCHQAIEKEINEAVKNRDIAYINMCAESCKELINNLRKVTVSKQTISRHKKEITMLQAKCAYYRFKLLAEILKNDNQSTGDN